MMHHAADGEGAPHNLIYMFNNQTVMMDWRRMPVVQNGAFLQTIENAPFARLVVRSHPRDPLICVFGRFMNRQPKGKSDATPH
jgi:hypothetical protein